MISFNFTRHISAAMLAALLIFGCVISFVSTGHASAAPVATTAVVLDGSPNDYILGGRTRTFTSANATFSTSADATDFYLSINGNGAGTGEFWSVWLAAPRGTRLAPGTYTGASRAPFRGGTQPGIDVSGDGRGCNQVGGQFVVEEAVYDTTGTRLTSFAASFEQHCEIFGAPLFGEVRYNSALPYRAIGVTTPTFGDQVVGATGPVLDATIANTGTDTLAINSVALAGTNAGDFRVVSDQCSAIVLQASMSCVVQLQFVPSAAGYRSAFLAISDDTRLGSHSFNLNARALAPRVSLSTSSLYFGQSEVGVSTTAQTLTIYNAGDAPLAISDLSITGSAASDFTQGASTCSSPVQPGQSCAASVSFIPTRPGNRSATFTITDNADNSPQTITLNGYGVAYADVGMSMGTSTFFPKTGSNLTYTVTIQNHGPDSAYDVTLTDALPAGESFVQVQIPQGTCTTPALGQTGTLVCSLGTVPSGGVLTLNLTVKITAPGHSVVSNTASISTSAIDQVSANNSATTAVSVHGRR